MSAHIKETDHYLAQFEQFEKGLNGQKNSLWHQGRRTAFAAFEKNGFPTTNDEEWRFTSLKPLTERAFNIANADILKKITKQDISTFLFADWAGVQLVFIDGHFCTEFSAAPDKHSKIIFRSLNSTSGNMPAPVLERLSPKKIVDENAFIALNISFLQDGAQLHISDDSTATEPIHVLFISTTSGDAQMTHPRLLISVGKNAQSMMIESYVSLADFSCFTNAVTDIEIGENAELTHYRLQNESLKAIHIGNVYVKQESNSRYFSNSITFGGSLTRNNLNVRLQGPGTSATLNGLYLAHGTQHIDNHTFIDHAQPHCESHELYQGVLSDEAHGVFSGKILVRPDAQKTDAKQSNNCLLLSDTARINSKPQLEIYADDVKCTHGATVGHLDQDSIFYLRSRGIPEAKAKNILTYAFAERVIEDIKIPQVREYVDRILLQRLKGIMSF